MIENMMKEQIKINIKLDKINLGTAQVPYFLYNRKIELRGIKEISKQRIFYQVSN